MDQREQADTYDYFCAELFQAALNLGDPEHHTWGLSKPVVSFLQIDLALKQPIQPGCVDALLQGPHLWLKHLKPTHILRVRGLAARKALTRGLPKGSKAWQKGLADLNMGSKEAWPQCAQQAAACCRSSQAGTQLGMNMLSTDLQIKCI